MNSPTRTAVARKAPESPDMKFARNRLGNLLSGMRGSDMPPPMMRLPRNRDSPYDSGDEDEDSRKDPFAFGGDSSGRGRGSSGRRGRGPGRVRRERRVVFELRGKPFELRDSGKEEAVFSLCRTWMRGKEDDVVKTDPEDQHYPQPADDCLDLLATKEIHSLPRPRSDVTEPPMVPAHIKKTPSPVGLDLNNKHAVIADFMPHWRITKKRWTEHTKLREKRYVKSIQLLETVFSIAQQNQLMA